MRWQIKQPATHKQAGMLLVYTLAICSLFGLILGGCGQRYYAGRALYHAKQAAKYKTKAISKGAKLSLDTTWSTIKLKTPPIDLQWEPKLAVEKIPRDTTVTYSQHVVNKSGKKIGEANVKIVFKDRVVEKIVLHCPEQEVEGKVATKIEEDIVVQPKFNFWHGLLAGVSLSSCVIVGVLVRRSLRGKEQRST